MPIHNGRPSTNRQKCDDAINSGHGEKFFNAFDMAFGLSVIKPSGSNPHPTRRCVVGMGAPVTTIRAAHYFPTNHLLSQRNCGTTPSILSCAGSPPIYTERAGVEFSPRHLNIPATSGTKSMLGDSLVTIPTSNSSTPKLARPRSNQFHRFFAGFGDYFLLKSQSSANVIAVVMRIQGILT